MKILDRYVLVSFFKNYCISFMVLVGMYVVLDMVFNFNNMVAFQPQATAVETLIGTLRGMADYYFYQCFLFFVHLSGIIPVVAAAFTLMRLTRFNELTAMLAAGVPLLRIAMPIVLASLLLNALLLVDQELLIPNMIPKLVRDHDEVRKEAKNYFQINFMQDAEDGLVHVSRYYPHGFEKAAINPASPNDPLATTPTMLDLSVIERVATEELIDGQRITNWKPAAYIRADVASWNPQTQAWDLSWLNPQTHEREVLGRRTDRVGDARAPEQPQAVYKSSNITPEEINLYRSGNYVDMLSTQRINELLDRPKSYGRLSLLRVKHSRFTQPLMNVILLLMSIPCVMTREPGRLKSGATKCLLLMGIGLGSVFLSAQMAANPPPGTSPDLWAAVMAWVPIFIFGPFAMLILDKIKT